MVRKSGAAESEPAEPGTGRSTDASALDAAALSPRERMRASLERLAVAVIHRGTDLIVDRADDLADRLEEIKVNGGVGLGAAFGAGYAYMAGKNPAIGAIKGAWSALSTGQKVGIVLGLVLLGLLSPVALLVVLIGLLVWAIVRASKS